MTVSDEKLATNWAFSLAHLAIGVAVVASLLIWAPVARAGQCEKRKLDEASKHVSCLLREASKAARDEAVADYGKCDSNLERKESSVARTCGESSSPSLSQIGTFLDETTSALVEGVNSFAVEMPGLESSPGPTELESRVRLDPCDFPPLKLAAEPCMLEIDGVKISCQMCHFEIMPTGEGCSLQKVLVSAEQCHVFDDDGDDIPIVQEP